jgi:collagenase-like PrtC family protease
LRLLAGAGATRWIAPVELGKETLSEILRERPAGLEVETLAFGRLPLAFSARCFSARANNRGKDQCGFICGDYVDGMPLDTQEDRPFLLINGIQIQSAATCNLIGYYAEMRDRGIDVLRLSPQAEGLPEIVATVRAVIDGCIEAQDAVRQLRQYETFGGCDGYWNGDAGIRRLHQTTG